jgi:hypothetical protein
MFIRKKARNKMETGEQKKKMMAVKETLRGKRRKRNDGKKKVGPCTAGNICEIERTVC